jgi:hypothetical protein
MSHQPDSDKQPQESPAPASIALDLSAIAAPPPASDSGSQPAQPPPVSAPLLRDRIIVLGRRRSGKTVYLARLYERLWRSKGEIHMSAVDGQTHLGLLTQMDAMNKKRWPASTETLSHFRIDVTYQGEKFLMVALDYPGEVFRRAFMEGSDEPAVRELLDNVDRAAAVIVLIDPGVEFEGDLVEQADQDFGLVAAIKRIREWPGAETVPVAITLTKCDKYRAEIEAFGGLVRFVKERYTNLYRVAFDGGRTGLVFACSAVRAKKDGLGRDVPDLSKPPKGLIEPIESCLKALRTRRSEQHRQVRLEVARRAMKEIEIAEAEADRKMSTLTGWLIGGGIVAVLLGGVITLWILKT